jgi:hypothetical protein
VHPQRSRIIKINIEGFEFAVLRGVARLRSGGAYRRLIVVGIKPWDIRRLGHSMDESANYMEGFDYRAYDMVARTAGASDLPGLGSGCVR